MLNKKQGLIATIIGCSVILGACQGGHDDPLANNKYKVEDTDYSISFNGKDRATMSWTEGAPDNMTKDSTPFNYEIKKDAGKKFLILKRNSSELPRGYGDDIHFYEEPLHDFDTHEYIKEYEIKDEKENHLKLVEKDIHKKNSDIDSEIDKSLYEHPDKSEDGRDLALTKQ